MKITSNGEVMLYVSSMRKALRVTAIFDNDREANEHMAKHSEAAVVACVGPLVLIADKYDQGINIPQQ